MMMLSWEAQPSEFIAINPSYLWGTIARLYYDDDNVIVELFARLTAADTARIIKARHRGPGVTHTLLLVLWQ